MILFLWILDYFAHVFQKFKFYSFLKEEFAIFNPRVMHLNLHKSDKIYVIQFFLHQIQFKSTKKILIDYLYNHNKKTLNRFKLFQIFLIKTRLKTRDFLNQEVIVLRHSYVNKLYIYFSVSSSWLTRCIAIILQSGDLIYMISLIINMIFGFGFEFE